MKTLLFALYVSFVPAFAFAQPIHNHPQLAAYGSAAQWPYWSAQTHWRLRGVPTLAHTHADLRCPAYAEIDSAGIVCNFTVKLFHTPGRVGRIDTELIRDMVWDATGSTAQPALIGDPDGLKIWTGHLTIDPTLSETHPAPLRGWFVARFRLVTAFDNGDNTGADLIMPFYSVRDPNAPETLAIPLAGNMGNSFSAARPEISWGVTFALTNYMVPIAPISQPWLQQFDTAGYGGVNLPPARFEQRADFDLHAGNSGRLLYSEEHLGDITHTVAFDPAVLGSGTHKMLISRDQPNIEEETVALFVFDVVVSTDAPPPPLVCTDPLASNFGGPLPCVYPPPPPVDEWKPVSPLIERFGTTNRFRLRIGTEIFEFQIKP